jgi:hypothetical protein
MTKMELPHDPIIPGEPIPPAWRCPVCLKNLGSKRGVVMHMFDKHNKEKHSGKIAEWIAHPTRTGLSQ